MKIRQLAQIFHADRQTGATKLMVAFRNFVRTRLIKTRFVRVFPRIFRIDYELMIQILLVIILSMSGTFQPAGFSLYLKT